eukprot:12434600-Alexandrium_andersonii.AAC.1
MDRQEKPHAKFVGNQAAEHQQAIGAASSNRSSKKPGQNIEQNQELSQGTEVTEEPYLVHQQ